MIIAFVWSQSDYCMCSRESTMLLFYIIQIILKSIDKLLSRSVRYIDKAYSGTNPYYVFRFSMILFILF